ncbi:hypothetical protein OUZ56_000701 [Daphnia magna]|uniref:Uncharacterized protein n=1 Tax=Daphnia magna TaxID=35525 RepID=A0ABR0A0P3_9CRUS|nr:hypothetical protein OUZ56_000701 [Daphnia magna]
MSGERRDSQRKVVNPFRSSRVATTRDTEPYPYCPLWALNGTEIAKPSQKRLGRTAATCCCFLLC